MREGVVLGDLGDVYLVVKVRGCAEPWLVVQITPAAGYRSNGSDYPSPGGVLCFRADWRRSSSWVLNNWRSLAVSYLSIAPMSTLLWTSNGLATPPSETTKYE